jgi:hypothetical protein
LPSARPSCELSAEGAGEVIDRFAGAVDGRLMQQEAVHLVVEVDVLDSR